MTIAAMVLAAGRGLRMRPLTEHRAKPSLPILGVSLAGRIVRRLVAAGLGPISLNAHHAPESLRRVLVRDVPATVTVHPEPTLMGTGGALDGPREILATDELFVVHNGDTLTDPPLHLLVETASERGVLGALLVRHPAIPGYGPIVVRGDRFHDLVEKGGLPPDAEQATYLGVAALRREVLDRVPRGRPSELFDDVLLPMLDEGAGSLAVVLYTGPWLEFTSPDTYLDTLLALTRARSAHAFVPLPGGAAAIERRADGGLLYRAPSAQVADDVRVDGAAIVEHDAVVEPGALLRDSAVLEGGRVGAGSSLRRTIVCENAVVERGSELSGCCHTAGTSS